MGKNIGISLCLFFDIIESYYYRSHMVVRLAYKYDWEENYTVTNELLMCEPDGTYSWENDWNEGQQDVWVVGYIRVEDVAVRGFEEMEKEKK